MTLCGVQIEVKGNQVKSVFLNHFVENPCLILSLTSLFEGRIVEMRNYLDSLCCAQYSVM